MLAGETGGLFSQERPKRMKPVENAIANERETSVAAYVFIRNVGEVFRFFVMPLAMVLSPGTEFCSL